MMETASPERFHDVEWRVARNDACAHFRNPYIFVPHDQAEGRVAAALAAGGHMVHDENTPGYWTLADAEGNEVDVASWPDRD